MKSNRSKILIGSVLVLIIIAGAWYFINQNQSQTTNSVQQNIETGPETGLMAPDFTLENLSGKEVSLSDFRGQKVFLNFWASWCPPCKQEMPDIQKLHKENKDIKVLTVNVQESKDTAFDYMISNNYSFTTLLDTNGNIGSRYLVRGIPTTVIIDEDGIILNRQSGALTYERMLELLSE
ncbi:MAG: TlpA disulfide reductase family protein [Halanaerobiales bacterium]|nr:TlpA disulfide reductase family protein [Halanaerobiales bacterium]